MVDNTRRIEEILPRSAKTANDKFLSWECLDFLTFPGADGNGVDIGLNATFKWLKAKRHDPKEYKTVPIHLLPPNMTFQDSCRLLVLIALMDGLFEDFQTWEELMSCRPLQSGSVIRVKKSALPLPVFSKEAITGLNEDRRRPWAYEDMEALMNADVTARLFQCQVATTQPAAWRGFRTEHCSR